MRLLSQLPLPRQTRPRSQPRRNKRYRQLLVQSRPNLHLRQSSQTGRFQPLGLCARRWVAEARCILRSLHLDKVLGTATSPFRRVRFLRRHRVSDRPLPSRRALPLDRCPQNPLGRRLHPLPRLHRLQGARQPLRPQRLLRRECRKCRRMSLLPARPRRLHRHREGPRRELRPPCPLGHCRRRDPRAPV